jgi:hypothetical protein
MLFLLSLPIYGRDIKRKCLPTRSKSKYETVAIFKAVSTLRVESRPLYRVICSTPVFNHEIVISLCFIDIETYIKLKFNIQEQVNKKYFEVLLEQNWQKTILVQ